MIDTEKLIQKLDELYGKGTGAKVCMTILPGVLSDFQKMLDRAVPGKRIKEEYRLEDGKGTLILTGSLQGGGIVNIEAEIR